MVTEAAKLAQKPPMPSMLYGTAWKKEQTADLVELAILAGFRGIDTACQPKHYHEAGVGEGLQRLASRGIARHELFLQTKFTPIGGQDPQRIPYDPSASLPLQVKQSFERSLINLGTDYLDSLVLHSPLASFAKTLEVWRAMEELHLEGGIRYLGISNCYDLTFFASLWDSARIKPSILQNRFYADTGYDQNLRQFCRERELVYQSFWTLTANPHLLQHPRLQLIAQRLQKTSAQILFRFLIEEGVCPLTGTRSAKHMHEDLAVNSFALDDGDRDSLRSLLTSSL